MVVVAGEGPSRPVLTSTGSGGLQDGSSAPGAPRGGAPSPSALPDASAASVLSLPVWEEDSGVWEGVGEELRLENLGWGILNAPHPSSSLRRQCSSQVRTWVISEVCR
jgi:hypothetical protein